MDISLSRGIILGPSTYSFRSDKGFRHPGPKLCNNVTCEHMARDILRLKTNEYGMFSLLSVSEHD